MAVLAFYLMILVWVSPVCELIWHLLLVWFLCISLLITLESQKSWKSLICGLQNGCYVRGMKTAWISLSIPNPWVTRCIISILKGILIWGLGFNSGLKMTSKPCCQQICSHSGIVPFVEHRHSLFCIILKVSRIFGMGNEHWLLLKLPAL